MGESRGRQLLTTVQREFVHSLHDAAAVLAGQLDGLKPDSGWDDTPFADLVLGPIEPADPVLGALARLATVDQGGTVVGLRGWRDSTSGRRGPGVAYVVRSGNGAALVVSVTPSVPALVLHASGLTGQTLDIPLANGWVCAPAARPPSRT